MLKPSKQPLIENGPPNKHAMRRQFLSRAELDAQLRLQGIEDIQHVRVAYLEPNGMISAFRKDAGDVEPTPRPPES
ncbi:YetF domain-containing protein [Ruicaihuangia caeni]|uniref:YetF domain-containing protein n=1 Tax=Ruicaihuangia caeni TaxID=3042517 RepID=UPI003BF5A208